MSSRYEKPGRGPADGVGPVPRGSADGILMAGRFDPSSSLPQQGWAFTGGDYSIAVHGDRFIIGESKKIHSIDELSQLLRQ